MDHLLSKGDESDEDSRGETSHVSPTVMTLFLLHFELPKDKNPALRGFCVYVAISADKIL